jgi:hypothetical protein
MKLKSEKRFPANSSFKKDNNSFLYKKRFYFFLCAMFQSAFIFLVADKTDFFNEVIFITSIIAVAIFILLAFIVKRGAYKVILTSIILFSALLVLDGITNYVMLLKSIIVIVLIYTGLINVLVETKFHATKQSSIVIQD